METRRCRTFLSLEWVLGGREPLRLRGHSGKGEELAPCSPRGFFISGCVPYTCSLWGEVPHTFELRGKGMGGVEGMGSQEAIIITASNAWEECRRLSAGETAGGPMFWPGKREKPIRRSCGTTDCLIWIGTDSSVRTGSWCCYWFGVAPTRGRRDKTGVNRRQ
jgi:hypothetical protein